MSGESVSIIVPRGYMSSSCGYCSPPGKRSTSDSSYSVGITASRLTCADYQAMLDRGWRRSGTYCYKPDMRRTCCPQYTIRLGALEYVPTKKQRKVISRWTRYVVDGDNESAVHGNVSTSNNGDAVMSVSDEIKGTSANSKSKRASAKKTAQFDLVDAIHAPELSFYSKINGTDERPKHTFEMTLEPASYSDEKFALYQSYQENIHKEARDPFSSGFKRFLIQTPLEPTPIPYGSEPPAHLPRTYGSYHQLYRLDGKLIALAVLDILPACVSSVYFMYDNAWEHFSLGKLSALGEVSLAREMHHAGARTVQYLYMGYYIHSCQKMRYKGEYSPSELLDPEVYSWHALDTVCVPLLGRPDTRYVSFVHPEHALSVNDVPPQPDPEDISEEDAKQVLYFDGRNGLVPLSSTNYRRYVYLRDMLLFAINGLGLELAKTMIFKL